MNITFYTGAGISAESGVPTFRGQDGVYTESGKRIQISPSYLDITSDKFGSTVQHLSELFDEARKFISEKCKPNKGHEIIAAWQSEISRQGGVCNIITTNVDDLHERAGAKTMKVHGDLFQDRTLISNGHEFKLADVVLFGEHKKLQREAKKAIENTDLFVVVGSSLSIQGDSCLIYGAKEQGAKTIEINPFPTGHPAFDVVIPKSASVGLRELYTLLAA